MTFTRATHPVTTQRLLREMTEQLIGDFGDHLPAGTVLRCVARCLSAARHAGHRGDLVAVVEAMARLRLEHRTETHPTLPVLAPAA